MEATWQVRMANKSTTKDQCNRMKSKWRKNWVQKIDLIVTIQNSG